MTLWGSRPLVLMLVLGMVAGMAQKARGAGLRGGAAATADTSSSPNAASLGANPGPAAAVVPALIAAPTGAAAESSSMAVRPAGAAKAGSGGAAALLGKPAMTRTFHDRNYKVSFDFPANWTFSERDHEISTFRLDARSAEKKTVLRAVTALPENPYPASTFTGAYVYLSVTPHSNQAKCAAQALTGPPSEHELSEIAGLNFAHGHSEQRQICTVERDEIYTTYRKGACFRFDLAMNNFCGGEVSGVKDVTKQELDTVLSRMESIMQTVRFDAK